MCITCCSSRGCMYVQKIISPHDIQTDQPDARIVPEMHHILPPAIFCEFMHPGEAVGGQRVHLTLHSFAALSKPLLTISFSVSLFSGLPQYPYQLLVLTCNTVACFLLSDLRPRRDSTWSSRVITQTFWELP